MKQFINKHLHIVLLAVVAFLIVAVVYITDDNVEKAEITIEHGDTLWALSELYRGKMNAVDWIAQVKKANNLHTEHIKAGEQLVIPVEENSYYVANKKVEQYEGNIEIASDMK